MKKKIILITTLMLCLTLLSGCGGEKSKLYSVSELPEGAWRDSAVNTITYIGNNFIAAAQGDTHYYVSDRTATQDGYTTHINSDAYLYREDMTGAHELEKIDITGEWRWINPVGDYLYYVNCNSGGMVYGGQIERYDTVTKQTKVFEFPKLANYKFNSLFVVGEQMYFTCYFLEGTDAVERLCRADLDGKNAKILEEDSGIYLIGNDDKFIYYYVIERNDEGERIDFVRAISLDGTEEKELFNVLSDDYWGFSVVKDSNGKTCIYGQATATESSVRTDVVKIYNATDGTETMVYEYEIDTYDTNYRFDVESSTGVEAYFTYRNADNNTAIGKFDHESLATAHIADTLDGRIANVSVIGDYVYYTTEKNVNGSFYAYIHRVNPDGSVDDITEGFER